MSRHGTLTQAWGDGEYTFRLAYGQFLLLEQSCDLGAELIAERIRSKDCRHKDVNEVIRLGLIGGGMSQGQAGDKVRKFVQDYEDDAVSWGENRLLAWAIIFNALMPPKDDALRGKAKGARKKTKASASQEERQPSPASSV